uniref:t-SNARE coiled-coil homology domain-containing protein n=1 Tax=Macrostomum lignano TaxID=282301 RepID=A0A1I8FXL6_9PLAT
MLMDSSQPSPDGSGRRRFLTRQGRLSFVDSRSGKDIPSNFYADDGQTTANLQALSRGLSALAARGGGGGGGSNPVVDEELTRLLAGTLAANGASLMIASSNSAELPSSASHRQNGDQLKKPPAVNASVVAREIAAPAVDEKRQELERLVDSLRSEVDALKSENSGLRDRLKTASESAASASLPPLPPQSATSTVKPAAPSQQQQRPVSKGSYQSLYEMLQEYMQENESLRTENLGLVKNQGDRLREQAPAMMQTQQPHHHAVAPEFPLYIPKPGEATYRGRFRQAAAAAHGTNSNGRTVGPAAAAAGESRRRAGPAAQAAPVQDVNRLNESLKSELQELDGAIQQHQRVNALQSDIRRGQGQKVLKTF